MSIETVLYIEDEDGAKKTYLSSLQRTFGKEYEIVAPDIQPDIAGMLESILNYQGLVSLVIDERLTVTGIANYQGTDLADAIREIDKKIPIYILTSYAKDVDQIHGSIEFVIDKDIMSDLKKRDKLASRIRRHLATYKDIKSDREKRFDELLRKSMGGGLAEEEIKEFEDLNFLRAKPILIEEQVNAEKMRMENNKQEDLLKQISEAIKKGKS